MHTYRRTVDGNYWQACFYCANDGTCIPLGPVCDLEWEAAAYASFLNGGRYAPDEIARFVAGPDDDEEDDDSTHPDRPKELEDYPIERKRK